MLRITDFRVNIDDDTPLLRQAAKRLKLPPAAISNVVVLRKALDARRKHNINFVYSLDVALNVAEGPVLARLRDHHVALAAEAVPEPVVSGVLPLEHPPVVIGFGPAGMLAAFRLAQYGYRPLVLERGKDIDRRTADIARFWDSGQLDDTSNVQFGEGGAGTFSDGKLTTRVTDPGMREVLDLFIEAGAPPEIKYWYKPHIGTDRLRDVVKNLRKKIIDLGGRIEFESQVTGIDIRDGKLRGITINHAVYQSCSVVLLGIGHSARDTYAMLNSSGVAMEAKPFAIGVRAEHPQTLIDAAQYGTSAGHRNLSPADYALVYHDKQSGRTAYSFCMCPGGLVVAAASEAGGVVTNGMSLYARASGIANSALVVNVNPSDCGNDVLSGIEFQRRYEQMAFQIAGRNYFAPAQTVGGFLRHGAGGHFLAGPSYRPGVTRASLDQCLPDFVIQTLGRALVDFGRKIKGFDHPDAVLTGVETRTSAPVRILRQADYMSFNIGGLYPIGEGAGYAGGIMSAALDGRNAAQAVIAKYRPPQ